MLRISLTKTACLLPLLALCLSGCGLTQRVSEGTKSAFNAVFYKKINTLHLDFTAREALNTDARENHSLSEPVVVRIYQLKDRQTFDRLVYQQLLEEDILLAADLLASRDVVIGPGGDASLNMPLEAEATFVAVVGLFRHPDTQRNTWKQVLAREWIRTSRAFSPPNTTSYGSGLKRRSNIKKQTFAAGPSRQFALNLRNQRTGDNHLHPAQPVSSQHREIT